MKLIFACLLFLLCVPVAQADAGPIRRAARAHAQYHRDLEGAARLQAQGVQIQAVQVAPYFNPAYQSPVFTPAASAWAPTVTAPAVCPTCGRPY